MQGLIKLGLRGVEWRKVKSTLWRSLYIACLVAVINDGNDYELIDKIVKEVLFNIYGVVDVFVYLKLYIFLYRVLLLSIAISFRKEKFDV